MSTKNVILCEVDVLVANFLYYDRREDETLPRGAIEKAIADGEVTVEEIVDQFARYFRKGLQ